MRPGRSRSSLLLRFVAGVLLVAAASLGVFYLLMQPRQIDLGLMAIFLSITSVITLSAGYFAYRFGWINRAPSLRWTLLATYVLSSMVTFINVWLTARLMFVNQHDLLLATILLLSASGIAIALGSFFSEALARRLGHLNQAVREIREGGFGARAEVGGQDEIADLAMAFNEMARQLQAADRSRRELESVRRELIAWVGHDLQTPLASVRAIIEALAENVVEDEETRQRYLHTAQREIKALSHLIDDLFEMAQIDAGGIQLDLQQNALSDLISDTLEGFSALADEKGVVLEGEVERGIDPVLIDAQRIGRALNNLVSNALRHTPAGGEVHVSACRRERGVEVEVWDTGEGLNAEDVPHIFERFYRGEKSRSKATGGTGLGLAISKGFIEAHGGEIRVERGPRGGARFVFNIPDQQG